MLFQPQEDENTNKNDMNETFVVSDNSEKSFEHLLDKDLKSVQTIFTTFSITTLTTLQKLG